MLPPNTTSESFLAGVILQRGKDTFKIYAHNITIYLVPIKCTGRHFGVSLYFMFKEAINQFPVKETIFHRQSSLKLFSTLNCLNFSSKKSFTPLL